MSSNRIKTILCHASLYASIPASISAITAIIMAAKDAKGEDYNKSGFIALECVMALLTVAGAAWGGVTGKQKADKDEIEKLLEMNDQLENLELGEPSPPAAEPTSRNWTRWLPSLSFQGKSKSPTQETDSTQVQQKTASVSL